MSVKSVWVAIIALALCTAASLAEPPSREALDEYLQGTSSAEATRASCLRFAADLSAGEEALCAEEWEAEGPLLPGDATDYEQNLVVALAEEGDSAEVIKRFAELSDRSRPEAELIVNLMIETASALDSCGEGGLWRGCAPTGAAELVALILAGAEIDHDGRLLTLVDSSLDLPALLLPVVDQLPSSPGVSKALRDGFNYTQDFRYIVVSTFGGEIDEAILQSALTRDPKEVSQREQFAYYQFLFEGWAEPRRSSDAGLLLTALRLRAALDLGWSLESQSLWSSLDSGQRRRMWSRAAQSHLGAAEGLRSREQIHRLMVDLAANRLQLGDVEQCIGLLESAAQIAEFTEADRQVAEAAAARRSYRPLRDRISDPAYEQIVRFLYEYIEPTLSPQDTYDMFVTGSLGPRLSIERTDLLVDTDGWLWSFRTSTPGARTLATEYVEARGHAEIGEFLRTMSRPNYAYSDEALELDSPEFASILASIPPPDEHHDDPADLDAIQVNRLTVFDEAPLPEEYRVEAGPRALRFSAPPSDLTYPVEPWQIVRWEREDDIVRLIYQSTELDPAGEISAGGYWFAESRDGGVNWLDPLYLGLQQYFPYVVLQQSSMPLVANDRLQIAVAVRALDPDSITFPPVGLSALREEDNLYISAPLAELRRDQDGDGLTDIYEHRIGLDMHNPDTDGDGLSDAFDGLPLTAFDPDQAGDGSQIARIMLEQVIGHDANALIVPLAPEAQSLEEMIQAMASAAGAPTETRSTLILRGDPSLFAGVATRSRIIMYDDQMIERISPDYGVFYPVGFSTILPNNDQSQIYVIWSAGWVGGAFYIFRNERGEYEVQVTSSWIT